MEQRLRILPALPPIPFHLVKESEIIVLEKYLECEINDKLKTESKFLRHNLGIGMPEATGIVKVTSTKTVSELISWYFEGTKAKRDNEINEHFNHKNKQVYFAIGSPSRTIKIIALVLSTAFSNKNIVSEITKKHFDGKPKCFQRVKQLMLNN